MVVFQDIEDVREWLDPLKYVAFWEVVAPYNLFSMEERDHCDGLIMSATVCQETILYCLKSMARNHLTAMFALKHRTHETWSSQSLKSLH